MKITDYPAVNSLLDADVILKDGASGTKTISVGNLKYALFSGIPAMHNLLFRGKNLGNVFTADQKAHIDDGSFTDLWVGDYWNINGVNWRIAAFNYWLNEGSNGVAGNHLVIVPDTELYNGQMNASATNAGGYVGSTMFKTGLNQANTLIQNAFGAANVQPIREKFSSAVVNGYVTGYSGVTAYSELMNEIMVYGTTIAAAVGQGGLSSFGVTQLPLFRLTRDFLLSTNGAWWTRDVGGATSGADFTIVGQYYDPSSRHASDTYGVRPIFALA